MCSLNLAQCPEVSNRARLASTGEYTAMHPSWRAISAANSSSTCRITAPAGSHSGNPEPTIGCVVKTARS